MKYIVLLFCVLLFVNAENLFEKLQQEASAHPTVVHAGGTCSIVNDPPNDVRANYLYYFCRKGSGSWLHYTFYWIHSLNPIVYQDFSKKMFCFQAEEAPDIMYSSTLRNISRILSC